MRKAEKALKTKYELSAALKELLTEKPLANIRIHELTDTCGLYRQTFYYHFQDVYDLLDWTFEQDVQTLIHWENHWSSFDLAFIALCDEIDRHRQYHIEVLKTRTYKRHLHIIKQFLAGRFEGLPECIAR